MVALSIPARHTITLTMLDGLLRSGAPPALAMTLHEDDVLVGAVLRRADRGILVSGCRRGTRASSPQRSRARGCRARWARSVMCSSPARREAGGMATAAPGTSPTVDDDERREIRHDFGDAVTMTAAEMKRWLGTDESQSVGDSGGNGESTGHEMGRHIVELLDRKAADLSDEDLRRMRKVVGYVHRHLAQRPAGDVTETRWRYSLMNWGHDPLK